MTSSYLLPGERDNSSTIVHTHGINRPIQSKQTTQNSFISIPRIYVPKEKDFVIGIVIVRTPDLFLVDINSSESAILPISSFDNGRLPNRNKMNRLNVVYAHVVRTDPWTQTELSCQTIDSLKKKSDFGLIEQGNILRCSLSLCEKLQKSNLINHFNRIVKNFRIRFTRNGFIWYTTDTINSMIAVKNILYKHEFEDDIDRLIDFYQILMIKLQQQDDSLVKVKQQTIKKEVKIERPIPKTKSTAVDRLLDQVVRSILDKIIDDIEKNENN
jgi:exosome complex RNA-binding protein Rrp4